MQKKKAQSGLAAKAKEYPLVSKFPLTYRNREDITNLPPGVLIVGSHDVLSNVSERIGVRNGYALDGDTSSVIASIKSSFDWQTRGNGEKHLRSGLLTQPTATITIASPAIFTTPQPHGYLVGQPVSFTTTGALPTGLTVGTIYYVIAAGLTTTSFEVSLTMSGTAVNTSGTQSGVHTVQDGKLQYRYADSNGNVTWRDLVVGVDNVDYNFTTYWDSTEAVRDTLFVNGHPQITAWNGATTTISSAMPSLLTKSGTDSWLDSGFYSSISGRAVVINGVTYTYSGGETTTTLTGVTPDPTIGGPASSGVIAYYKLDGNSNDSVGTANGTDTAIIYNTASGKINQGALFNGITSVITYPAQSIFNGSKPYSHSLWIRVDAFPSSQNAFVSGNYGGNFKGFAFYVKPDGTLIAVTGLGSTNSDLSLGTVELGTWYLATATYDGTTIRGYMNGLQVNSEVQAVIDNGTNQIFATGRSAWNPTFGFFTGAVDEIGIWNVAEDQNEVSRVYNNGVGLQYPFPAVISGDIVHQAPIVTLNSAMTGITSTFTNGLIQTLNNQVFVGSLTSSVLWISRVNSYTDYTSSTPRQTGEGSSLILDDNLVALQPQEQFMYVSAGKDRWYNVSFELQTSTVGVTYEQVNAPSLKTGRRQGARSQAFVSHIKNDIVTVTYETTIDTFGRIETSLATPQTVNISDSIKLDIDQYDFTGGSVAYHRNYIYVAIPADEVVLVYSLLTKSWEAPQNLPITRFYAVDGELYGHSSLTSESYQLFTGYADRVYPGFAGHPIDAVMRFSYENYGSRFTRKRATSLYVEGYISANTVAKTAVTYEIDGCATVITNTIDGSDKQIVCISTPAGSLGKVSLGKTKLGGQGSESLTDLPPKFRVEKTFQNTSFFESSVSFEILGVDSRFELLAFGLAAGSASEEPISIRQ